MKYCTKCGTQCDDSANACSACGTLFNAPVQVNKNDHTAEFKKEDIEKNKFFALIPHVIAVLGLIQTVKISNIISVFQNLILGSSVNLTVFSLSIFGIIVSYMLAKDSEYACFHIKNAMKFTVLEAIIAVLSIVPAVGAIFYTVCIIICVVLRIIEFFNICGGKAKDPAIIRSMGFLK